MEWLQQAALLFLFISCRISSSVHWSNKAYRWFISLCMSFFMTSVVVNSLRLLLHGIFSNSQYRVTSKRQLMVELEYDLGESLITRWMCLDTVTLRRESEHVHVYFFIQTLHSLHHIWQFWQIVCYFLMCSGVQVLM